jgi:uncharacterized OB-fold protein
MSQADRPLPSDLMADDIDLPFWEGCRDHEFRVHRCGVCGRANWPAAACVEHGASSGRWVAASGLGHVHTYTIIHQVYAPIYTDQVPYVVAVVKLEEGPFFYTDLLGCDADSVAVGLPVEVEYEDLEDGTVIPHFRPR